MKMTLKLILICFLFSLGVYTLYSPYYKRCRFTHTRVDPDAIPIQDLEIQRAPYYYSDYYIQPVVNTELQLQYQDFDYLYHEYIDAGGSGQVYLVQQVGSGQGRVVKRFFQEKPIQFRKQNYIMKKLNYSIRWAKDCSSYECQMDEDSFNTLSIFPHKESIVLRKIEFEERDAPLLFYKILKELDRAHRAGIIHNDLKLGNIMINSLGPEFKFYEVQLIDWNLASFYYTGLDVSGKKGTICYYAPQQLLRSSHITPAIDVWALGIVMFVFYTDAKPFAINCKPNNLRAIASLVGGQKMLDMYKKYRYGNLQHLDLMKEIQANLSKFPERKLQDFDVKENKQFYTKDLIEVFKRMFQPDPQLRATPAELMQMDFFKNIKVLPEMYVEKNKRKSKRQKSSQIKQIKKSQ